MATTYHIVTESLNRHDPSWEAGVKPFTKVAHKSPGAAMKAEAEIQARHQRGGDRNLRLNIHIVARENGRFRKLTEDEAFDGMSVFA